jgi:hypothetical protein
VVDPTQATTAFLFVQDLSKRLTKTSLRARGCSPVLMRDDTQTIDLNAVVAKLELGLQNFLGMTASSFC